MGVNEHERLSIIILRHQSVYSYKSDVPRFTVTVGSSTMRITHSLKWVWVEWYSLRRR